MADHLGERFGITAVAHSTRSLGTQDGAGTITYMAPEQILGKPRPASDQYALGIIAYEWMCGSRPFNGTAIEIAMQHAQASPPPLREKVSTLPPVVERVVLKALEKDYEKRFGSVQEFAEALATAVEQSRPKAVPQKTKEQWLDEGVAHGNAGKYKEAIEKNYHQAIEDFDRALQLDPSVIWFQSAREDAYHKLGWKL